MYTKNKLTMVLLMPVLMLAGCGGGGDSSSGSGGTTPQQNQPPQQTQPPPQQEVPPSNKLTVLVVKVDANCTGQVANIKINVDNRFAGTAQPGDSGISTEVEPGDHVIDAKGEGASWPPRTQTVSSAGSILNLQC